MFELPAAFTERPETRTELQYLSQNAELLVADIGATVLFLLAGAAYANTGVLEERRRVACDIHDGVAQELSFIASQIRALPTREEDPETAEAATARTAATYASLVMPSVLSLRNVSHGGCSWEPFRRLNAR